MLDVVATTFRAAPAGREAARSAAATRVPFTIPSSEAVGAVGADGDLDLEEELIVGRSGSVDEGVAPAVLRADPRELGRVEGEGGRPPRRLPPALRLPALDDLVGEAGDVPARRELPPRGEAPD